jgi:large repetitive protein
MKDQHFDDLARRWGKIKDSRTDRRTLLHVLGIGAATALTARATTTIAQDATPSPEVPAGPSVRAPGGKALEDSAFELELDAETIFRFVADEVRYEPYAGALRGPKGTLWGLAGNSVDKAQLLAELLKSALFEVRFAIGTLDAEAANQVLAAAALDADTARAHAEKVQNAPLAAESQVDLSNLTPEQQAALEKLPQTKEELLGIVQERLAETVATLEGALNDAGVTVPSTVAALPDSERNQHVWVQYASGTEWVDLDPTLANATAGDTLTTATETLDELPPELFHALDIRVIAEENSGGVPTRRDVLFHNARAQDLVGVPLTVMHVKPDSLKGLGVTIASAFGGALQWAPHLIAGENVVAGEAMSFKSPEGDIFGDASTPTDAVDALGGETSGEGDTLAAWLAVDLHTPDGQIRSAERVIFDRVDPADRLAGTFDASAIPPIELTPTGTDLGDVYLPLVSTTTLAVAGHQLPGDFFSQDYTISDPRADLANVAFAHHFVRSGLEADLATETGYRLFPTGPNVTGLTLTPTQIEAGTDGRLLVSIDMFHQAFGATALDGSAATGNPAIISGVLGHLAERAIFGELLTVVPTPEGKAYRSVGRVFEEAANNNIPLTTLQPGTTPAGLDVSPSAASLITEALTAGYIVVVPERGVPLDGTPFTGWWQVNPLTGETFDRTELGGSQDMTEYNILLGELLEAIHKLATLAMCIAGVGFGAAAIVGAFGAGGAAAGWGGVIFGGAMCLAAGFG